MGVTVTNPSYALRLLHQLDALRDDGGRKYAWTPCMDSPIAWDEESTPSVKANAARRCLGFTEPRGDGTFAVIPPCPALLACHEQAVRLLGAGERPRGVWAGVVMPKQGEAAQRRRRRSRSHSHLPPLPPDRFPVVV
jgi:hypothetical protein